MTPGQAPPSPRVTPPIRRDAPARLSGEGAPAAGEIVPIGLRRAAAYAWRLLLLAAVGVLALLLLARLEVVVLPVLGALLATALLEPAARRLRGIGLPSTVAAALVLVAALALLTGLAILILPAVAGQFSGLNLNVTIGLEEIENFVARELPVAAPDLQQAFAGAINSLQEQLAGLAGRAISVAALAFEVVVGLIVTVFLTFFFLKDGHRFRGWLREAVPEGGREHVQALAPQLWATLKAYVHGILLIGLVDSLLLGLGLALIGVPLIVPLMVLSFLGAFFPFVGAIVVGAVAALVALAAGGVGDALLVVAVALAVHQVEGNLLHPLIMGRQVELHPAVTLLSVIGGGALAGVVGAFLGVPVAAVVTRVLRYVRSSRSPAGLPVMQEPL